MVPPPSGEQHEIAFGDQLAVVTEVGATLRRYAAGGREVLDGFDEGEICSGGRGQLLIPWPNRLRDGAYAFGGRRLQLPLSEPDRHNASHGLVRWAPWRVLDRSAAHLRLGLSLHPQPGYPFLLELAVEYALGEEGLAVRTTATNPGSAAAPFGMGSHPYLRPRAGLVDGATLRIPARTYLEVDERLLPTGRRLPVGGTELDFGTARPIGGAVLDVCYTDLEEPAVEFDGLRLWWDGAHSYLQAFTGDSLGPERRRRGLALEPMSCPADAFNSGDGLVVLEPGGSWTGAWGIQPAPGC